MTLVPAQIEFAERAKAARARMAHMALAVEQPAPKHVIRNGGVSPERRAAWDAKRHERIVERFRLASSVAPDPKAVILRIKRDVASRHNVSVAEIDGLRRSPRIVAARQETYWRVRTEAKLSLLKIAMALGRDHTSVLWGIRQHEARMAGTSISRVKSAEREAS